MIAVDTDTWARFISGNLPRLCSPLKSRYIGQPTSDAKAASASSVLNDPSLYGFSQLALKTTVLTLHSTITHRATLLITGRPGVYHHTQVARAAITSST